MSLGIAFRAFFSVLFNRQVAARVQAILVDRSAEAENTAVSTPTEAAPGRPEAPKPAGARLQSGGTRSDAVTLLSTLQREARLVDLICEPLDQFTDAQIGAAAREVLKDSRSALDRMFAIQPLSEQEEGQAAPLDANASPARVRIVGKSQGDSGVIVHRGWRATKCELPAWKGNSDDRLIVAPAEIEIQ
jgi:hypothetical protein